MANTSIPNSFITLSANPILVIRMWAASGLASKIKDAVCLDSAGRAAAYGSDPIAGLQLSAIYDQDDLSVKATAAVDDFVDVNCDPATIFRGQISTFAKTNPYTTRVSAGCFDVAGSAGAQYVDAAATTNDSIRVLGLLKEEKTGTYSEIGAYAKVLLRFNTNKHFATGIS